MPHVGSSLVCSLLTKQPCLFRGVCQTCRQVKHNRHTSWLQSAVLARHSVNARRPAYSKSGRRKCHTQQRGVSATAAVEANDPGNWSYSPEWWGTHAGGWGRDAGTTVFAHHSHCGNGKVTVTAHAATPPNGSETPEQQQQWRVLRFNDTRQSVSRVALLPDSNFPQAKAECLAFEYLKTMASAGAAVIALAGKLDACLSEPLSLAASPAHSRDCGTAQVQSAVLKGIPGEGGVPAQGNGGPGTHQPASCRALCVGLGGGSLPNFLSHHFPGLHVDAVELDPTVVAAATQCMGFPHSRPNLRLHEGDAADYILKLASQVQQGRAAPLDLVFIDAFDGNDDVPSSFCSSDSQVLDALAVALHPRHGSLVMNLHGGGVPTHSALVALFSAWLPFSSRQDSSGYHQSTEKGQAVQQIASTLRDKLLGTSECEQHTSGTAFTLSVARQTNITVVVTRATTPDSQHRSAKGFAGSAEQAATAAGYLFDAASRAQRGMTLV